MAKKTIFERWTAVRTLSAVFSEKGVDLQQVKALKEALCKKGIFPNWKGALLGASSQLILDIQYLHLDYSNSLEVPIKMEERTNFFPIKLSKQHVEVHLLPIKLTESVKKWTYFLGQCHLMTTKRCTYTLYCSLS